jgi:hypothetical protein
MKGGKNDEKLNPHLTRKTLEKISQRGTKGKMIPNDPLNFENFHDLVPPRLKNISL